MKFDQARAEDLDRIIEIERAGFSEAEAGSPAQYKERIQKFTGSFLVARNLEEEVVGFITGQSLTASMTTSKIGCMKKRRRV